VACIFVQLLIRCSHCAALLVVPSVPVAIFSTTSLVDEVVGCGFGAHARSSSDAARVEEPRPPTLRHVRVDVAADDEDHGVIIN
jgi:hypothetical protein